MMDFLVDLRVNLFGCEKVLCHWVKREKNVDTVTKKKCNYNLKKEKKIQIENINSSYLRALTSK